jgi:LysR family transcriptional regulator of abg operon
MLMERGTLKTTQLQMLVAIAEHGTLMAAAHALNVSQPAVTKSIKELEARLGVQLLERSGAGVRLTRYGETLLRRARAVVAEIASAERELEEMRSGAQRTLSIGVSLLASSFAMPAALRAFRARLPDVRLNVYECLPTQIIDGLRDGSFDVCVAFVASSDVTAEYRVLALSETAQVLAGRSAREGDAAGKAEPRALAVQPYARKSAGVLARTGRRAGAADACARQCLHVATALCAACAGSGHRERVAGIPAG